MASRRSFASLARELQQVVDDAHVKLQAIAGEGTGRPLANGKWSSRQVLGHLIDSAVNNHHRFIRAQQESPLVFPAYAQQAWVELQGYQDREWSELVSLWYACNGHLAHVIGRIPESASGVMCQIGANPAVTLEYLARDYLTHLRHHLEQLLRTRCAWARTPLSVEYHDREWGVPVHDDRVLFEFLTLEGAQAGLSWETILRKREAYREAFAGFDPAAVARFQPRRVERLMKNPGIVRNRLKIASTIGNARAFVAVQEEFGSFDAYVWAFVGGTPRVNRRRTLGDIPARTAESDALSRDLLRRGFKFVGSTICYAFMQAVGMVNDHTQDCFRANAR